MAVQAPTPAQDLIGRHHAYRALVGRLLDLVHRSVPPGATVLVVSKGDSELVSLVGRRGWHFLQDDSGGYAGYHPRDSAAAIQALEALRERGADFFVLPASASWWLEHYADFGEHLRRYETLVEQPDTGVVYRLRQPSASEADEGSEDQDLARQRHALLVEQIQELVRCLVPLEQAVVVAESTAAPAVHLEGRTTRHLQCPVADDGEPGTVPVAQLESLRRQGVSWLVVAQDAFEWWETDQAFRTHVEQRYRCTTRQQHVCLIYELVPTEEVASR